MKRLWMIVPAWSVLLVAGCATPPVLCPADPLVCENELLAAHERLIERPEDPVTLRELGVAYVQVQQFSQAEDPLQRAYARAAADPRTRFYLALTREALGELDAARDLYATFEDVPEASPYRLLMRGRHHVVLRAIARRDLPLPGDGPAASVAARLRGPSVAVLPFRLQSGADRYAPLGRGLAELIRLDLEAVASLRVVDPYQVQLVLDEPGGRAAAMLEAGALERLGRRLAAEHVVGGALQVEGGRLELKMAGWMGGRYQPWANEVALRHFYQLQQEAVVDLLALARITPTPEQRLAIGRVPTRNLRAFLAFSRGLEAANRRAFQEAEQAYTEALQLDPAFQLAATYREALQAERLAGGPTEDLITRAAAYVSSDQGARRRVSALLQRMGLDVSALGPAAGEAGGREPAQEAAPAGSAGLPNPPRPPSREP